MPFDLNLSASPPYHFRMLAMAKTVFALPGGFADMMQAEYNLNGKHFIIRAANGRKHPNNLGIAVNLHGVQDQFLYVILAAAPVAPLPEQLQGVVEMVNTLLTTPQVMGSLEGRATAGCIPCTYEQAARDLQVIRPHVTHLRDMLKRIQFQAQQKP